MSSLFGDLLRRHRMAIGLTQEELAERAGLSVRGISDLERGERVRPHRDTLARLCGALQLSDADRALLEAIARGRTPPRQGSAASGLPVDVDQLGASVALPLGRLPPEVRGRQQLLHLLREHAGRGGLAVLAGLGGVGKSTIAAELARRTAADFGVRRWWVSASERSSLIAGVVTVARHLGASRADLVAIGGEVGDAPDRLWALLDGQRQGWLLVVDNADRPAMLFGGPQVLAAGTGWIRPGSTGFVLVTSRDRDPRTWGREARVYPVSPLSDRDASEVLRDLAPRGGSRASAAALARRLGGLPLALHLAGSYLRSDIARLPTFTAYREALEREATGPYLLSPDPDVSVADERREAILQTWEMSLDDLIARGVLLARTLLRLICCYAAAAPIPLDLLDPERLGPLISAAEPGGQTTASFAADMERALRGLARLGLLDVSGQGSDRGVLVHPLVADANRAHLLTPNVEDVDPERVRHAAIRLVADAVAPLQPWPPIDWARLRALTPHLLALLTASAGHVEDDALVALAETAVQAARIYNQIGAAPQAAELARGVQVHGACLGQRHLTIIRARHEEAKAAAIQGRWTEAETAFRELLRFTLESYGSDHPDSFAARHELARAVASQSRWGEAESTYRELERDTRRVLGDDHPDTLGTRHELARAIASQGRWAEAESAYRELLQAKRRVLGDDHPQTLVTAHSLARAVASQGRWSEAEAALLAVLQKRKRVLGDEHPDTLITHHILSWVCLGKGQWERAETWLRWLYRTKRRVLGDNHPETLFTCHELIRSQAEQGRWGEAEIAFRHLLESDLKVLGHDHVGSLITRCQLGRALANQGRWKEARDLLGELLADERRVLGDDHPSTLDARHEVGRALAGLGLLHEAEAGLGELLRDEQRLLGRDHPDTLATGHELALAIACQGRTREAAEVLHQVVGARRRVLGEAHPHTRLAVNDLSRLVEVEPTQHPDRGIG